MQIEEFDALLVSRGATLLRLEETQIEHFVAQLQGSGELQHVPRSQLEWLIRESSLLSVPIGVLLHPGDPAVAMNIFFEGEIQAYIMQSGQKKVQFIQGPGIPTGLLPFSRMKAIPVFLDILSPAKLLCIHQSRFHELVARNYELTEAIVHSMTDRVRHFSTLHFQNEKLMSLGKLSAGIAHELNNPAAAIVRSAEDLKHKLGSLEENLRATSELFLTDEEIASILPILDRSKVPATRQSLLERKRCERELTDWLESKSLSSDAAETFLTFGYTRDDLDAIAENISKASFEAFILWLESNLFEQRSVDEIGTAARRISELVQSVKSYTRMDQMEDMQELCINDGIRNTITMLQHKIRKNSVELHEDLAAGLPYILGFPGELNQVWTNIIDNALDAMSTGGNLAVSTATDAEYVIFSVVDTGPGIPQENLERIFDPFFTTKDVSEGTGVGLDLVQKVVTSHKGTINVNSKPGRTEFRVAFPRMAKKA